MARPWQIEFEGAYYHVLSRGNERVLFGLTYSSVSHIVKRLKAQIRDSKKLKEKHKLLNSQYKI